MKTNKLILIVIIGIFFLAIPGSRATGDNLPADPNQLLLKLLPREYLPMNFYPVGNPTTSTFGNIYYGIQNYVATDEKTRKNSTGTISIFRHLDNFLAQDYFETERSKMNLLLKDVENNRELDEGDGYGEGSFGYYVKNGDHYKIVIIIQNYILIIDFDNNEKNAYAMAKTAVANFDGVMSTGSGRKFKKRDLKVKCRLEAVQVMPFPENAVWAQGKAGVFRVFVEWRDGKVLWMTADVCFMVDGKEAETVTKKFTKDYEEEDLKECRNSANFVYIPNISKPFKVSAIVKPLHVKGDKKYRYNIPPAIEIAGPEIPVTASSPMNFTFYPLSVGEWSGKAAVPGNDLMCFMENSLSFVKEIFPVAESEVRNQSSRYAYSEMPVLTVEGPSTSSYNMDSQGKIRLLEPLQNSMKKFGEDFIVGVVPHGWPQKSGSGPAFFPGFCMPMTYPNSMVAELELPLSERKQKFEIVPTPNTPVLARNMGLLLELDSLPKDRLEGVRVSKRPDNSWKIIDMTVGKDNLNFLDPAANDPDKTWLTKEQYLRLKELSTGGWWRKIQEEKKNRGKK
ncbi:MAG: hypothetical protein M1269_12955 [Chloroflexi bacterium]|nr:hypothetical protein [Chloroflexota bacterium]